MVNSYLIKLDRVSKVYRMGRAVIPALRDVNLSVERGEFLAVVGPSGSGKSTLLNIISGIDKPSRGTVVVDSLVISDMDENSLARWRGEKVGIVFQFFQLLPTLTALENVILPMELRGTFKGRREERGMANLALVGLADRAHHLPAELSGGEQQRVAIARALANDPPLILADEPTGNLDAETGKRILALLGELNQRGKTIVLVTHEEPLTYAARRMVFMRDGRLTEPKNCW
ncbi:MAG: ABC transporter ATP-binding protein [Anaerolineae bacterium]